MKCQIHGYFCVLTIGYHKNVVVSENACSLNSPGIEKKEGIDQLKFIQNLNFNILSFTFYNLYFSSIHTILKHLYCKLILMSSDCVTSSLCMNVKEIKLLLKSRKM